MATIDCDPGTEGSLCSCLHLSDCTFSSAGMRGGREGVGPGSNVIDSCYSSWDLVILLGKFFLFALYFCIFPGSLFKSNIYLLWDLRITSLKNSAKWRSQDGGGIGWGDHFLPYKFIERTIERWANFTKQLLIASRVHQVPRKAAHWLRREVGQNIKDKKGDKRARGGDPSREGNLNRGSFQPPGNPRAGGSEGSFRISEGNLTGRKN